MARRRNAGPPKRRNAGPSGGAPKRRDGAPAAGASTRRDAAPSGGGPRRRDEAQGGAKRRDGAAAGGSARRDDTGAPKRRDDAGAPKRRDDGGAPKRRDDTGAPKRAGRPAKRRDDRHPGTTFTRPLEHQRRESVPRVVVPRGKPLEGEWLWTSRPGSEGDVVDELVIALGAERARMIGPGLITSQGAPTAGEGGIDLTFARQGFRIAARCEGDDLATACARAIAPHVLGKTWSLAAWVPDTDQHNPLAPGAASLEGATVGVLESMGAQPATPIAQLPRAGAIYAQIAMIGRDRAIAGTVRTDDALSLVPGGRARMRVGGERPSRAARKVEEALAWLGVSPGAGETCVDLGAAPGGWSWVLLEKRARVIAVDPADLRPDIARHRNLIHHKASAFQYQPDEPVDWLFCDMAWKPLEVAQLLAKWGRRRWSRLLVANLKLPMKTKAATVEDLKSVIAGGGWQRIRARQLYHDRDEITLTAHL